MLAHLQTPAARGGHEFGDWPVDQIANGFGGDLGARHRHDHTRLTHVFHHPHPEIERDAVRDAEQASTGSTLSSAAPRTPTTLAEARRSATARPP